MKPPMKKADSSETQKGRRAFLASGAVLAGAAALGSACSRSQAPVARNGRIQQSVVYWCFNAPPWNWNIEQVCQAANTLGCPSVEIAPPEAWPVIRKHGLVCAIAGNGTPDPPFVKGLNNTRYHDEVISATRQTMEQCRDFGIPNVIAFTGFVWKDAVDPKSGEISRAKGADNCVRALRELALHGEKTNVTVCLEMLNTRDTSHPMKGHPGYQGDDMDYCAEIVQRVGSPRVKLLFDVYHLQIMQGDVIRRIRQYKDWIGHVHVAGSPGRGELDNKQEINFPAVMHALLEAGYQGYVGQEFIPTRDPLQGLTEAVALCDV